MSWLRGGFAGVVAQLIIDGIAVIFGFLFATGSIDDPVFGAAWWDEYRNWSYAFFFPLIGGIYLALRDLWWLSLVLSIIAFVVFLLYQRESCVPFEDCNFTAFMAWGTAIAFLAPAVAAVLLVGIRKLVT